jgi:hypothetical protein
LKFGLILFSFVVLISCESDTNSEDRKNLDSSHFVSKIKAVPGDIKVVSPREGLDTLILESDGIILSEMKRERNDKASINLETEKFSEGKNTLRFLVNGMSTFKIACLLNNSNLSEFSSTSFDVDFMFGNNVFLAFLTDSNNISLKNNQGSVFKSVVLGGAENLFDMEHQQLFYYLPNEDTSEAVLDFYLANTALSESGNKVRVFINDSKFLIQKWAAYKISGLKKAENTIRIQLVDQNNELIDGPFNDSGERLFYVR